MTPPESLTERLASHWANLSYEDIPSAVVDRVKYNILDTLAVALAGTRTPEAERTRAAFLNGQDGDRGSLVWGTSSRLVPAQAALVNGTAVHARDFDDGGGPGHAGATVLPAAIAAAEATGTGGAALIAATVAGYDIGYRTLAAVGGFAAHTDRGWHSTGTFGSFAAAAAAAKILELDADKYADALGIAGSFTGGVWAFIDDGAWTKRIHPGKACETGIDAALLARAGITGPRRIFEATWGGLFSLYTETDAKGFPDRALAGLGDDYNVDTAYIKPYACCRGCHSTIDTVLALILERDLQPEDVRQIDIIAGETAVNMLSVYPIDTVFDAQFSLPYAVSIALHERSVGLDQFDPPRINEPEIQKTFQKISMQLDSSIQLEDGPQLRIELTDGDVLHLSAGNPTTAKGSAQNPLSYDELVGKVRAVLKPYGDEVATDLIRAVENLDEAPDLDELLRALRAEKRKK